MSASSDIIDADDSLKEVHAERRTVSSMNIPVAKPEPPLSQEEEDLDDVPHSDVIAHPAKRLVAFYYVWVPISGTRNYYYCC